MSYENFMPGMDLTEHEKSWTHEYAVDSLSHSLCNSFESVCANASHSFGSTSVASFKAVFKADASHSIGSRTSCGHKRKVDVSHSIGSRTMLSHDASHSIGSLRSHTSCGGYKRKVDFHIPLV